MLAAAGTAASGAMSVVGLAVPYKQASDLFKLSICQDKRFFCAGWAESAWRHGESVMQAERHHYEGYAMAEAAYQQGEKHHRREFNQARLQHERDVDITLRAETREALRDELAQQNNRVNNVQLCITVCLGCAFGMLVEGIPPDDAGETELIIYISLLGLSTMLLTSGLWCTFILMRRLNEYTANIVHCMLAVQLHQSGQENIAFNPAVMSEEFKSWLARHCDRFSGASMLFLSLGVVSLFGAAGTLTHSRYMSRCRNVACHAAVVPTGIVVFWSFLVLTVFVILFVELQERRLSKRKMGVYSCEWKNYLAALSPYFNSQSPDLNQTNEPDDTHSEKFRARENEARVQCTKLPDMKIRRGMHTEASQRSRKHVRSKVRNLLSAKDATDDFTPDDLICTMNDVVQDVRHLDVQCAGTLDPDTVERQADRPADTPPEPPMRSSQMNGPVNDTYKHIEPGLLHAPLGAYFRSTLVRMTNRSPFELRLKKRKIRSGGEVESLTLEDSRRVTLRVPRTIPPHTEVVFACRARFVAGIDMEVAYDTSDASATFTMGWTNPGTVLGDHKCTCDVEISRAELMEGLRWRITKSDFDLSPNNQIDFVISCDTTVERKREEGANAGKPAEEQMRELGTRGAALSDLTIMCREEHINLVQLLPLYVRLAPAECGGMQTNEGAERAMLLLLLRLMASRHFWHTSEHPNSPREVYEGVPEPQMRSEGDFEMTPQNPGKTCFLASHLVDWLMAQPVTKPWSTVLLRTRSDAVHIADCFVHTGLIAFATPRGRSIGHHLYDTTENICFVPVHVACVAAHLFDTGPLRLRRNTQHAAEHIDGREGVPDEEEPLLSGPASLSEQPTEPEPQLAYAHEGGAPHNELVRWLVGEGHARGLEGAEQVLQELRSYSIVRQLRRRQYDAGVGVSNEIWYTVGYSMGQERGMESSSAEDTAAEFRAYFNSLDSSVRLDESSTLAHADVRHMLNLLGIEIDQDMDVYLQDYLTRSGSSALSFSDLASIAQTCRSLKAAQMQYDHHRSVVRTPTKAS